MNRRSFLQLLGASTAAVVVAPHVLVPQAAKVAPAMIAANGEMMMVVGGGPTVGDGWLLRVIRGYAGSPAARQDNVLIVPASVGRALGGGDILAETDQPFTWRRIGSPLACGCDLRLDLFWWCSYCGSQNRTERETCWDCRAPREQFRF